MATGGRNDPVDEDARPKAKRRRLPGVALRPGAVKQARQDAGLSLAQVGKGHVTAPAIYLIETGRTRPSLPTLEHIAQRTGKPLEYFLADRGGTIDEGQVRLIELEVMVDDGSNVDAVRLGLSLLEHPPSAYRLGRIRYLLARAYAASGQPERAMPLFAQAKAQFEAGNDAVMVAACLGAQAALMVAEQPTEAVTAAETALSGVRGMTPVPLLTAGWLLGVMGDAHAANGGWDSAIAAYEEAIQVSGAAFDLRAAARTYAAMGRSYREAGELEKAARYGLRSIALLEVIRDREALAHYENKLAVALISHGDLDAARQHLDRSLELSGEVRLESRRSEVLLTLCDLSMREGDVDRAHDLAAQALELAERLEEGANVAEAHIWLGRIADRIGNGVATDREFAAAIRTLEQLGARERLFQVHGTYAEILERRGDLAEAYVHMKKALKVSRPGLLREEQDEEQEQVNTA